MYGNSTPEQALHLYNGVLTKLKTDCKTRPLLPSQLVKEREVELRDPCSVFATTNGVHRSSCIENYYQCGLQDTRNNMLLELFSQIINEDCYNQLRTKEQLGYTVYGSMRNTYGTLAFTIYVNSQVIAHCQSRRACFVP